MGSTSLDSRVLSSAELRVSGESMEKGVITADVATHEEVTESRELFAGAILRVCERVADCCARFAKCSKYKCWWSSDPLSDGYEVVVSSARAVCSLSTSLRYCDTIAGPQRSFVTPRPGEIPAWATQPAAV